MIVYMNEANLPLAGVPKHLLERRFEEWCGALMHNWGVRFTDGNEHGVIRVDISSASPQGVFAFLESSGAVCVDLEPNDIPTLAGRSVETLTIVELMQADPAVRTGCERLTIEEIMSTIGQLVSLALNTSNRIAAADAEAIASMPDEGLRNTIAYEKAKSEQAAVQRMKQFGLDVGDVDPSVLDAKPAPEPEEFADFTGGVANAGTASPWNFE